MSSFCLETLLKHSRAFFVGVVLATLFFGGCKRGQDNQRAESVTEKTSQGPLTGCHSFEVMVFLPHYSSDIFASLTRKFRDVGDVRLSDHPPYAELKKMPLMVVSLESEEGILSIFKESLLSHNTCLNPTWKTKQSVQPFRIPYKEQIRGELPLVEAMVSKLAAQYRHDNPHIHPTFYIHTR